MGLGSVEALSGLLPDDGEITRLPPFDIEFGVARQTLSLFEQTFTRSWPPKADQIAAYKGLMRGRRRRTLGRSRTT